MQKQQILKIAEKVYNETGFLEDFLSQLSLALDKEEEKGWVPVLNRLYYFISDYGDIQIASWSERLEDKARLTFKNVFKTKEAAEARLEAIKKL